MWDCINTFNTCTFENIYKIEDELYNFSENEYMKLFLILLNSKFIVYIKGGNVNVIVLGHVLWRTNLSDKFGNMFRTRAHFEEKVTLLKFVHFKPCVFAKSVVFHYLR